MNPKKNSLQPIGYPDARKTIGKSSKKQKNEKLQKIKKNSSDFRHFFCHI